MEKWKEQKIKEIETNIDNTIVGLNTARCMAIDVSCLVAVYDGKCWNNNIEDEINKKLSSTYDGRSIAAVYINSTLSLACNDYIFRIVLQDVPYIVPALYVGNDKSLYTKAHNYRINVKDIQEQIEAFIAKCDKMTNELKRDKENLISVISQYHTLLEQTEQIANSVSTFTCDAIQDSNLFQRPVYRFF